MIVAVHIASGAVAGTLSPSRRTAAVAGILLHALGDRIPHREVASRRFELACGAVGLLVLAAADGSSARTTVGAVAAALPDVEHVLSLPRPGGRKLFPSHRLHGWHRAGGVSAGFQLLLAGVAFGWVVGRTRSA